MKYVDEGRRLQLFMEREGLTHQQLADEYEIDRSQITRYISGILKVPLELVKFLHIKYRINYSWFFHGTGTMKVKELEKRKITTDITDILASQSMILAAMESMREDLNRLAKDFYATKHNV